MAGKMVLYKFIEAIYTCSKERILFELVKARVVFEEKSKKLKIQGFFYGNCWKLK